MIDLNLLDVVHHVVLEELVDVILADLANTHAINPPEGSPRLKPLLLG